MPLLRGRQADGEAQRALGLVRVLRLRGGRPELRHAGGRRSGVEHPAPPEAGEAVRGRGGGPVSVKVRWDPERRVWWARKYLGRDRAGKRRYPYRRFPAARSEAEAQAMADTWEASLTAGGAVRSALLPDLLADYIDMRERNGASPNSVKAWRSYLRRHIAPAFARDAAASLTVLDFTTFEQRLLAPKEEGGAGLSRNTVLCVHHFLRGAYNHLSRSGVVEANPLALVAAPRPERREAGSLGEWDFGELNRAVLSALSDEGRPWRDAACAMAMWLALHAGLRLGEALALRGRDVERSRGFLRVGGTVVEQAGRAPWRRGETKGHRCRNVSLAPEEMGVVASYLDRRGRELGRLGADAPLVTLDGSFMRPSAVTKAFSRLRGELGLPAGMTFHGLRHTHASWLLASGVDVKTLSERLGHADAAVTMRVYAHVLPGRDSAAAEAFARAAGEATGPAPGAAGEPAGGVPTQSQRPGAAA